MYSLEPSLFLTLAAVVITVNTAPTGAESCTDSKCNPQVDCGDIAWTCNADDVTTTAPGAPPREDLYCCDYFGTCKSKEEISGKVLKRTMNVETGGQKHKTDWLDLYVDKENEHVGSWVSYIEDLPSPLNSQTPYNITDFYSEPAAVCTDSGAHKYPGWYHVALASVVNLNITGLTIEASKDLTCNSGYSYSCTDGEGCAALTTLADGEAPITAISTQANTIKCNAEMGDDYMENTTASTTLLADLDGKSPNDDLALLYGWVPLLADVAPFVEVTFKDPGIFIVGIGTGGLTQDVERSVDSFTVSYVQADKDGKAVGSEIDISNGKKFFGGAHLDTWVTNYFPDVYRAKSVKITVKTPAANYTGMRFRILGCKVCEYNHECPEGKCTLEGKCDYTPAVEGGANPVDAIVVKQGVEELGKQNVSSEGVDAYKELLGHSTGTTANGTSTINPKDVDATVADAVVKALASSIDVGSVSSNDSKQTNTSNTNKVVTAIAQTQVLLDVVSGEGSPVFQDLNTPKKVKQAKEVVQDVVNLIDTLANPANVDAWKLSVSSGEDDKGKTSSGPQTTKSPGPKDEAAEVAAATKEQKEMTNRAVNMITGISSMTSALVSGSASNKTIVIKSVNLEAVAEKPKISDIQESGYEIETKGANLGASLKVPAAAFEGYGGTNDEGEKKAVTISTVVLDSTFLRTALEKTNKRPTEVLASSLLSFTIKVDGKKESTPLTFELNTKEIEENDEGTPIEKPRCVFHDTTDTDDPFAASSDGMSVNSFTKNSTNCRSGHTTTFAVMMYLDDTDELGRHFKIQSKLTMFCGTLSVVFVAFAVAVFSYLRSTLMSERIMIHVILMGVTGLAMLTFMLGAGRTENVIVCKIVTIVIHFLYTAMFAWMLNEGIHLYRQIITVFETGKSRFWIYHVIGWGIPVCIVGISAGMQWNKYGKGPVCFLDFEDGTLWAFIGPIIPVILINFVVLFRVTQIVVGASKLDGDGGTVNSVKAGVRSSLMLLPLLGMTWVVGYFQHLHISLSYLFVILNALQGFFMAIFHCFFNTEVREGLKGAFKKIKANSVAGESSIAEFTNKKSLISTVTTTESHGNKVAPMSPFDD